MRFLIILITLSIFDLAAYGSTYLSIQNGGEKYCVSIWKHTEDQEDTVITKEYGSLALRSIEYYLQKNKSVVVIFNDGVFTALRYGHGDTKRWAMLTPGEKDMITFLQEKFDLNEMPIHEQSK